MPVLAADSWPTNAALIRAVARLGYLREHDTVLDPTFGEGGWWKLWRPGTLVARNRADDGSDFRKLDDLADGTFDAIAYDPPYVCVSMDTEILTKRGWKHPHEVETDDETLTLNRTTGQAEWQPIEQVNIYPAGPHLIEMVGHSHSSMTTPNHRWPVIGKRRTAPYEWDRTDGFRVDSRVPLAAPLAAPTEPKWSDALVEAVAWFWTEGHIENGDPSGGYGHICQSMSAPDRCARIRGALTALFGPPAESFPRVGRATDGTPRWRERPDADGRHDRFWLSADAGRALAAHAPGRVPTHEFLLSLTAAQLRLFLDTSMMADGHDAMHAGRHARSLGQRNRAAAEAFQFAAILAGEATSIRPFPDPHGFMWEVRLRNRRFLRPSRIEHRWVAVDRQTTVWCPRTPNETWLARRQGTVWFTGNCPGGRDTSTIKPMHARYGMNERTATDDPEFGTPAELQQMIDDGLTEMWRLVRPAETVNLHATRPNGIVLVKCKDYIWGGRLWAGTHRTLCHADDLGFECWDRFEHLSGTGPQPAFNRDGSPRPQRHARRNLTTLLVLRRPKGS